MYVPPKPYNIMDDVGLFPMMHEAPDKDSLRIVVANYDFAYGGIEHYEALRNYETDPRKRLRKRCGRPRKKFRPKGKHKPLLYMYGLERGLKDQSSEYQRKKKMHSQKWKRDHRNETRKEGKRERATHPPGKAGFDYTYLMSDGSTHTQLLHDSGCSHHCIDSDSVLAELLEDKKPAKGHYLCGGGGEVRVTHTGYLPMKGYPSGKMKVKVTVGMGRDVFSATQAACDGFGFHLSRKNGRLNAYMQSEDGTVYALYEESFGGLLHFDAVVKNGVVAISTTAESVCHLAKDCTKRMSPKMRSLVWKNRFCQEGDDKIRLLMKQGHKGIQFNRINRKCAVDNFSNQTIGGPKGKTASKFALEENETPPTPLPPEPKEKPPPHTHYVMDLVVSTVESVRGFKYCLTVVELTHRTKHSFMLKKKSHTHKACEDLFEHLVAKHGVKPTWVRPDRGGEFMDKKMIKLFRQKYGATYSPAQTEKPWMNGIAEHSEKDSQKRARAMLMNAGLPKEFWCYAMQHAGYLSNLLPHKYLDGNTPNFSLTGKLFDYSHLRVFGCPAFVSLRKKMRKDESKWAYRSREGMYMGWKVDHETHLVRFADGKHVDCTDVEFNELFEETFHPQGMKTTSESYRKRNKDGSPPLFHTVSGKLAHQHDAKDLNEDTASPRETEEFEIVVERKRRKRQRNAEPLSPVPKQNDSPVEESKNPVDNNLGPENLEVPVFSEEEKDDSSDESGSESETDAEKEVPTRTGRIRKPPRAFEPEAQNYKEQKRAQEKTQKTLTRDWNNRKRNDHAVRDQVPATPSPSKTYEKEQAEFRELNYHYLQLHERSTSSATEYMHSAATRPTEAAAGSDEEKILKVKDPKTQKQIRAMDDWNKKRFNDSTDAEKNNFFDDPKVTKRIRITDVPPGETLLNTMCVWVTKFLQGKYDKTKARIVVEL